MHKNKILWFFMLLVCLLARYENAAGQTSNTEKVLPRLQSMYIYHITKYFLWPPESSQQDFTIGIIGESSLEINHELETMAATRKVNGQDIIVKHFPTPEEITDCHVLFVPFESSNYLSDILMKTQRQSTLVITAKEGLGKVGSPVNLIMADGKLSFELNTDAIEKRTLKFAQQLKAIAIII